MRKFFHLFSLAFLGLVVSLNLLTSCDKKIGTNEFKSAFNSEFLDSQQKFSSFISAYTNGDISAKGKIRIELLTPNNKVKNGTVVDDDVFSFKPKLKGSAQWVNATTVEFTPSEPLLPEVIYEGTFHLGKIQDVDKDYSEFPFKIYTNRQEISISNTIINVIESETEGRNTVSGDITLANVVDVNTLEQALSAKIGDEALKVIVSKGGFKTYRFQINNVPVSTQKQELTLAWEGEILGVDNDSYDFEIPANDDVLDITSVDISNSNEITIYFSDYISGDYDDIFSGSRIVCNFKVRSYNYGENWLKITPRNTDLPDLDLSIDIPKAKSRDGMKVSKPKSVQFKSRLVEPSVELMGNGSIVPQSSGLIVPFRTKGLYSVDIRVMKIFSNNIPQFFQTNSLEEKGYYSSLRRIGKTVAKKTLDLNVTSEELIDWKLFKFDISDLVEVNPGSIYKVVFSFRRSQTPYSKGTSEDHESGTYSRYWSDSSFDYYYPSRVSGEVYDSSSPRSFAYYNYDRWASRNFIASNIAIIAKKGGSNVMQVQCLDILDTDPVEGAKIDLISYQQQVIASESTNKLGFANVRIPKDEDLFLIRATKDNSVTYLDLHNSNPLPVSSFDVGGATDMQGVKAMIYAERDVWRPGDSIYFNVMIEDKFDYLPNGHPIVMKLINPEHQVFSQVTETFKGSGIYEFKTKTYTDSPTGSWLMRVIVGGMETVKFVRIETVKPNKIAAEINIDKDKLYTSRDEDELTLSAKWLNGEPASNLEAYVEANVSNISTKFKNYGDYNFDDLTSSTHGRSYTLLNKKLDSQGNAKVDLSNLSNLKIAGFARLNLATKIYEESGDFSIAAQNCKYSAYNEFVGIKDDNNNQFLTDQDVKIKIVSVDVDGNPIPIDGIRAELLKYNWSWWWSAQKGDMANFQGATYNERTFVGDFNTKQDGTGEINLNIDNRDWGVYMLRLTTPDGNTSSQLYYFDWPGWVDPEGKGNGAEQLHFEAEKETYAVDDMVTINVPSTEGSKLFVSLEQGNKILNTIIFEGSKGSTEVRFKATKDMVPNVYASITSVQPHEKTVDDLPIRMFGVANINVESKNSHLKPIISTGGKSKFYSNAKLNIDIKEENGQPMTYSLVIVDNGLLSLTNYHAPDPWNTFNKKIALGVNTWDMYSSVLGAMSGEYSVLSAIGGGDYFEKDGANEIKGDRFIPIVKYLGVFDLKKGGTNKHSYVIPEYNGSLRIMAVAMNSENKSYGSSEENIIVKDPISMHATLPRVLRPNEKVQMPITLFCSDGVKGNVGIKVDATGPISVDSKSISVKANNEGETIAFCDLSTLNKLGHGVITVTATNGNISTTVKVNMDVIPSSSEITQAKGFTLKGGESIKKTINNIGIEGSNENSIEVSVMPPMRLESRLNYLISYPHGCLEQKSSNAFGQIYLSQLVDLSVEQSDEISNNVTAALSKIRSHQLSDGRMTYWSGGDYYNEWAECYAGNLMFEAKRLGYSIPSSTLDLWVYAQKKLAIKYASTQYEQYRMLTHAYRLYVLALAGEPVISAMNTMRELKLSSSARYMLASAYFLIGESSIGNNLLDGAATSEQLEYGKVNETYGSSIRDKAIYLETLLRAGRVDQVNKVAREIANSLNTDNWYSTQTTAFSLKALAQVASYFVDDDGMTLSVKADKTNTTIKSASAMSIIKLEKEDKEVEFENKSDKPIYIYIVNKGIPQNPVTKSSSNNLNMSVRYVDENGDDIDISELKLGQNFTSIVKVKNTSGSKLENLALTQIFPAGYEINNDRLLKGINNSNTSHQDIRDDRVMTYFDLGFNSEVTIKTDLTATYVGEFMLPAVNVQAMYDNTVFGIEKGGKVKIYR